jgi:hypothetical protein
MMVDLGSNDAASVFFYDASKHWHPTTTTTKRRQQQQQEGSRYDSPYVLFCFSICLLYCLLTFEKSTEKDSVDARTSAQPRPRRRPEDKRNSWRWYHDSHRPCSCHLLGRCQKRSCRLQPHESMSRLPSGHRQRRSIPLCRLKLSRPLPKLLKSPLSLLMAILTSATSLLRLWRKLERTVLLLSKKVAPSRTK